MGNMLHRRAKISSSRSRSSRSSSFADNAFDQLPERNPNRSFSASTSVNMKKTKGSASGMSSGSSDVDRKKKYGYIPDNFTSLDQVTAALREAGLESSNLILGIDFTKSNEWTGKLSFNNRSLHAIGDMPNPYEKAISIIGKTLAPFDEDNLIPCFGFGDATTHDQEVFSFHSDHSSCHGFEEVMACYRRIVPNVRLSGPTSYGPVVDAAVDIVEKTGGQYHVLVIIADGQVTRSVNVSDNELSEQEERTINSIVNASLYPLSIVLVGVGDGPWDDMKKFDDKIPAREFDNFQFVNFTEIMSKYTSSVEKETAFALAALMEIPLQYKAAREFRLLGRVTGKAKKIVPRPPPVPYKPPSSNNGQRNIVTRAQQQFSCYARRSKSGLPRLLNQYEEHGLQLRTPDLQRVQHKIVRVPHLQETHHKSTQAVFLIEFNLRSSGRSNDICIQFLQKHICSVEEFVSGFALV